MASRSRLLLGLFVLAPVVYAGDPDAPVPLWKAAEQKLVRVKANAKDGCQSARLEIQSDTDDNLFLELNGSYLVPGDDDDQPLGIGVIAGSSKSGVSSVKIGARDKRTVEVLTVCMAEGKKAPPPGARYVLATKEAPAAVASALAAWRADPENYGQQHAQQAAWGHEDSIARVLQHNALRQQTLAQQDAASQTAARIEPADAADLPAGTASIGIVGGEVFSLGADGTLSSARAGAPFARLEKGVSGIVACGDALHVRIGDRVARYDASSKGGFVDEAVAARPGNLVWASAGGALIASSDGVFLVKNGGETAFGGAARALAVDGGAVVVVPGEKETVVTRISCENGAVSVARSSVAAVLSACAPSGSSLHGVTESGSLVRIEDATTKEIQPEASELVAGKGSILARSGRSSWLVSGGESVALPRVTGHVVADPATGDFYAWDEGRLSRFDAEKNAWERVRFKK